MLVVLLSAYCFLSPFMMVQVILNDNATKEMISRCLMQPMCHLFGCAARSKPPRSCTPYGESRVQL